MDMAPFTVEVPSHDLERVPEASVAVLEETVAGMRDSASGSTAVLRPRSVARNLRERVRSGPIAGRRRP